MEVISVFLRKYLTFKKDNNFIIIILFYHANQNFLSFRAVSMDFYLLSHLFVYMRYTAIGYLMDIKQHCYLFIFGSAPAIKVTCSFFKSICGQ